MQKTGGIQINAGEGVQIAGEMDPLTAGSNKNTRERLKSSAG